MSHTAVLRKLRAYRAIGVLFVLVAMASPVVAQAISPTTESVVELGLSYATMHARNLAGNTFWLQGAALDLNAHYYRGLGMAASFSGFHTGSSDPAAIAQLSLVTVAFGPSYTFHSRRRVSIYSEALLGEAHGFNSLFAFGSGPTSNIANGTTSSANALAFQTGGSVNLRLKPHLVWRTVQVDYLRTQLPNGGTNVQNNLRLSTGLIWRFGQ